MVKWEALKQDMSWMWLFWTTAVLEHPQEMTVQQRLERIIYFSDEREVYAKYVAGEKAGSRYKERIFTILMHIIEAQKLQKSARPWVGGVPICM